MRGYHIFSQPGKHHILRKKNTFTQVIYALFLTFIKHEADRVSGQPHQLGEKVFSPSCLRFQNFKKF